MKLKSVTICCVVGVGKKEGERRGWLRSKSGKRKALPVAVLHPLVSFVHLKPSKTNKFEESTAVRLTKRIEAMSAFAARQQLWGAAGRKAANENASDEASDQPAPEPAPVAERVTRSRSRETSSGRSAAARSNKRQSQEQTSVDTSVLKSKKSKMAESEQAEHLQKRDSEYVESSFKFS